MRFIWDVLECPWIELLGFVDETIYSFVVNGCEPRSGSILARSRQGRRPSLEELLDVLPLVEVVDVVYNNLAWLRLFSLILHTWILDSHGARHDVGIIR